MIGVMPLVELQYVRVLHGRRLDPMGSISSGARASPTARARRPGVGPPPPFCFWSGAAKTLFLQVRPHHPGSPLPIRTAQLSGVESR